MSVQSQSMSSMIRAHETRRDSPFRHIVCLAFMLHLGTAGLLAEWAQKCRSPDLKDYTLQRNGSFGRLLLEAELAAAGTGQSAVPASDAEALKVMTVFSVPRQKRIITVDNDPCVKLAKMKACARCKQKTQLDRRAVGHWAVQGL